MRGLYSPSSFISIVSVFYLGGDETSYSGEEKAVKKGRKVDGKGAGEGGREDDEGYGLMASVVPDGAGEWGAAATVW
ncbi:unnamed protein product [Linum trigynum]|uniref:Uncharacterized protein n=1 Tax=Linum trigynum TaxID=586398 RepID=A0AAV2FYR9_9ROSI